MFSRRSVLAAGVAASLAPAIRGVAAAPASRSASGPVTADWESLAAHYKMPDWFRDAKLGLWSHWGPQCVPERGDWYGRQMYMQGNPYYEHHVKTYGHPSKFGFMEFINKWRGEKWRPDDLARKYKAAGAKYIVSMANHHDNLDMFASSHHEWNTLRVGPKRDIVGIWEKAVRKVGLRFGVSNHAAHAWHWWQTAYAYDAEGPMRGARYDAYRLTKADGAGKWWAGLDPQKLYTGPSMVAPDGIDSIAALNAWHDANDGVWLETLPTTGPAFAQNWLLRQMELVEKYNPDLVYMDNYGLPLERYGLAAAAHFYNRSIAKSGKVDVVLNGKKLDDKQRRAITDDVERGFVEGIREQAWQTCTCIGNWHYDRELYDRKGYKSAKQVVQRLMDVVSKNGNLLLSIPQRGDGSIDDEEEKILAGMTRWMKINGEAVFASRPWRIFGEGPTKAVEGMQSEEKAAAFTAGDVRFTTRKGKLYAALLDWPEGTSVIASLGKTALPQGKIGKVILLGHGALKFRQDAAGLHFNLPPAKSGAFVPIIRIEGTDLA